MKYLLFLLALCTSVALPSAHAQQAPAAATLRPAYGVAEVVQGLNGWFLALADGITPNPRPKFMEENGKNRRFEDEAAVLNFLYAQGWEVLPNGTYSSTHRYLLKRRTL